MALAKSEGSLFIYVNYSEQPTELSYKVLSEHILSAVTSFRSRGVDVGTRVLLPFETHLSLITSFLALTAMGAIPMVIRPIVSRSTAPEFLAFLSQLTEIYAPEFILDAPCLDGVDCVVPRLTLPKQPPPQSMTPPSPEHSQLALRDLAGDETAFVQFSSGSTSFPKGVVITHANLAKNLSYIRHFAEIIASPVVPTDSSSSWLPLYHDMGLIGGLLSPLWHGLTIHLAPPQSFLIQPLEWLVQLSKSKASHSAIPHFAVRYLLRHIAAADEIERSEWDLSHLKVVFNGSEPINGEDLLALADALAPSGFRSCMLQPSYGMAEAVLLVACATHSRPRQVTATNGQQCVCVGAVHPAYDVRIVDEHGDECDESTPGEIWLRGGSLAPRYLLDTIPLLDDHGFYHTGDVGFLVNGELFISGRISDRIKINGQSFFASDFEIVVERLPFVGPGRVVAFQMDSSIYVLVAVPPRVRADERRREIRHALSASLGVTVPVDHVRFVRPSSLKKTSSGKLKRNEIRSDFCCGNLISQ